MTLNASLKHVANTEIPSHLPHVDGPAPIHGGRMSGNDVKSTKPGEIGNDVFGYAVGESGGCCVAAHIFERQRGD